MNRMQLFGCMVLAACLLGGLLAVQILGADSAEPKDAESTKAAPGGVRLLIGFEWDEYAANVGRGMVIGQPVEGPAASGFRATRIEKLGDVGPEGFQLFFPKSSRDHTGAKVLRKFATQGNFAWLCPWTDSQWKWHLQESKSKSPGAWPAHEPYYSVTDHFYQRESQLHKQEWGKLDDWSGYERLRFDVHSVGASLTLGVRVRDGQGPLVRGKPSGVRTPAALFTVPADQTVTCDFPLADFARVCEMDLSKVHRYNIRVNGFPDDKAPSALYLDNIRLVAKGAEPRPKLKLIGVEGEVRPFARPVDPDPPTVRVVEKLKREVGPVEPLGPVVINPKALYAGRLGHGAGHFGRSGATYFSTSRRAVVAYDNNRLAVVLGGTTKARGGEGGTIAIASFDGGKTWGGLKGEENGFTSLPWFLRSNFTADRQGNIYAIGTPNCDSYNEGQDICMHRLGFTGETWVDDRLTILHQDGYKCPHTCTALMLDNGRTWAAWGDGFGGSLARYSDDDAFTFAPCKDASLPAPRPFREPTLRDWAEGAVPDDRPKEMLLWPTPTVPCSTLVPYKEGVAVMGGGIWAAHDGKAWGLEQKFDATKLGRGLISVTALDDEHLFVSRSAHYDNLDKETLSDLVVADMKDGQWTFTQLDAENVSTSIVTASGKAVFCFYIYKAGEEKYEVRYRRWADGAWGKAVTLATDARRLNHVAAPQYCPPDFAVVMWDQFFRQRDEPSEVKFMRVPNR